jgi:hypothetical protein
MLRQLEPALVESTWDFDFLRRHCAVCDPRGKIDSLYIAMRHHTLSWHSLRRAPVYMEGLEESWAPDPLLDLDNTFGDGDEMDDGYRPAAGDIVSIPTLKRAASSISRSNSFGSAAATADGEASRVKRTRPLPPTSVRAAGVETA